MPSRKPSSSAGLHDTWCILLKGALTKKVLSPYLSPPERCGSRDFAPAPRFRKRHLSRDRRALLRAAAARLLGCTTQPLVVRTPQLPRRSLKRIHDTMGPSEIAPRYWHSEHASPELSHLHRIPFRLSGCASYGHPTRRWRTSSYRHRSPKSYPQKAL